MLMFRCLIGHRQPRHCKERKSIAEGGIFKVRPLGSIIVEDDKRTIVDSGYVCPAFSNTHVGSSFSQMKKIIYFKEDTQELKELPIVEDNCYYLGEFTDRQIKLIERYLMKTHVPFVQLKNSVNNGMFA